jgi:CII-binding regulator of phage lambda lysogenization HflD
MLMLGWLRGFLTDTDALEQRLTGELRASEERLSRRMSVIEQRLAENEQVLRRLGHKIARIEGRASALGASAPARGKSDGNDERQPGTQPLGS